MHKLGSRAEDKSGVWGMADGHGYERHHREFIPTITRASDELDSTNFQQTANVNGMTKSS